MNSLTINEFLWSMSIVLLSCTRGTFAQSFQIKRENLNRRLVSCTFLEETVLNHHDCARACFRFGGKCKSINYNKKSKKCELNAEVRDSVQESEFEVNEEYIFSDITDWPKVSSILLLHHFSFSFF